MNKKGFTLVELLTIIILLAIITIIVYPQVSEQLNIGKKKLCETLLNNAETSAEIYFNNCNAGVFTSCTNMSTITNNTTGSINIPITELIRTGALKSEYINDAERKIYHPITKSDITSSFYVTITKEVGYKYTFKSGGVTCTS